MLNNYKIILNVPCKIENLSWLADDTFQELDQHTIVSAAIYIFDCNQFAKHKELITQLVNDNIIKVILCNPDEGSESAALLYTNLGMDKLVDHPSVLVISGEHNEPNTKNFYYEYFLPKILDHNENTHAINEYSTGSILLRPYKFLFLNGRRRAHRKYLIQRFKLSGLINDSLWSNLDSRPGPGPQHNPLIYNNQSLSYDAIPIQCLPTEYEVTKYQSLPPPTILPNVIETPENNWAEKWFIKDQIFNNEWGEIYLEAKPYLDTYFSLITETTFDQPHSFRTEKLWKPVAIGHPFIVASNVGYYRDLQNIGFKTFGHLIDESFDTIDNNQDRIDRIVEVVEDLCRQDLAAFLEAAAETCKYNQQHLVEMSVNVRKEFPQRFENFINERFRI